MWPEQSAIAPGLFKIELQKAGWRIDDRSALFQVNREHKFVHRGKKNLFPLSGNDVPEFLPGGRRHLPDNAQRLTCGWFIPILRGRRSKKNPKPREIFQVDLVLFKCRKLAFVDQNGMGAEQLRIIARVHPFEQNQEPPVVATNSDDGVRLYRPAVSRPHINKTVENLYRFRLQDH